MRHVEDLLLALGGAVAVFTASPQTRDLVPAQLNGSLESTHSASAEATANPAHNVESEDAQFLLEALRTDIAEMQMGELAQQRAGNAEVRDYGEQLQADCSSSVQEMVGILQTLNVATPSEPTVEAQAHHDALARLSGAEFDAAFLATMITSHEEAIEKYSAQTHANPNKQLSHLATKALPVLREHLATAESLQSGR
jgi:putative membrane protein